MKATVWFRAAAVVMMLFAVLHTIGFLTFRPPSAEGMAVWNGMNNVSFEVKGGTYSYGHFYRAFGLSITAVQLFGAWVLWILGGMASRGDGGVKPIAWGVIVWQVIGVVIAAMYVSSKPAMMSGVTAVFVLIALLRLRKPASREQSRA